jgi:hypothetical protein
MSGGHFDYAQSKIGMIADEVEQLILDYSDESNECGYSYPSDIIESFKTGLHHLKLAQIYAQRIDWLVSGDDGEDSFRRRLAEELKEVGVS